MPSCFAPRGDMRSTLQVEELGCTGGLVTFLSRIMSSGGTPLPHDKSVQIVNPADPPYPNRLGCIGAAQSSGRVASVAALAGRQHRTVRFQPVGNFVEIGGPVVE